MALKMAEADKGILTLLVRVTKLLLFCIVQKHINALIVFLETRRIFAFTRALSWRERLFFFHVLR